VEALNPALAAASAGMLSLSKLHVERHLAIGDVLAGQRCFRFGREESTQ